MRNFIQQLMFLTYFFWIESIEYMKPWKFKNYLYAPIAYIKFMYLFIKDYKNNDKN